MWALLARFILRYRTPLLVAMVAITIGLGWMAQGVRIQYGLPRMLPSDNPTLVAYDEFRERFKEESTVFAIGIERDLFADRDLFNRWFALGRTISQIEGVDTVLSVGSAFNIVKDTVAKRFQVVPIVKRPPATDAELDSLREAYANLPFYNRLIYNPENGYSLMAISMSNERFNSSDREEFLGAIVAEVESFEAENSLSIKYSGMPFIRESMSQLIKRELRLFIAITLLVTVIILLFFFRRVAPVLISMAVVGMGVVWSLGVLNWLGYEITILTSLIPPLIIVIGIPNCIYLINKFLQELSAHGNRAKALVRVVSKIGVATFMTNATTAAGFSTFMFTDSIILEEFGLIASISILLLFFISLFSITIAYSFMPVPKGDASAHLDARWAQGMMRAIVHLVTKRRTAVYITTGVVCVVALFGVFQMETTGNIVDDLPDDSRIVTDLRWFEANFGGVVPFEIEIDARKPKQFLKSSYLEDVETTAAMLDSIPVFSRSISIVDALKFIRQAFYGGNAERYALIENREKAFFKDYVENAEKNQNLLEAYLDSTQRYARLSMQVADIGTVQMDSLLKVIAPRIDAVFNPKRTWNDSVFAVMATAEPAMKDSLSRHLLRKNAAAKRAFVLATDSVNEVDLNAVAFSTDTAAQSRLQQAIDGQYTGINITGPSVTFLEGTNYLVNNLFSSIAFAILLVGLLMAAIFNSLRMVVISVITNLIPLLITAAIMGYFGIAIKPSTLLVFSIAFGISVDDTIHYLSKYRQELKLFENEIGPSVHAALSETGVSMMQTSIILFFGFSVFDLSEFGGTQALGILVSLTLFVAMFCNLILLPSFLLSFERRMLTKSFREPFLHMLDEEDDLDLDKLDFGKPHTPPTP